MCILHMEQSSNYSDDKGGNYSTVSHTRQWSGRTDKCDCDTAWSSGSLVLFALIMWAIWHAKYCRMRECWLCGRIERRPWVHVCDKWDGKFKIGYEKLSKFRAHAQTQKKASHTKRSIRIADLINISWTWCRQYARENSRSCACACVCSQYWINQICQSQPMNT